MSEAGRQPARRLRDIGISVIRQMAALRRDGTIDLGLGESDVAPAEWMREAASRIARESPWTYSPNAGLPGARAAVARYLGHGDAERVCITAGSQEALFAAMQSWVEEGDEVLVPDPGFLAYPTIVRLAGGTPVSYRLSAPEWSVDRDHFRASITDRTRMVIVNSPSNPTGAILPDEDLDFLVEMAERHTLLIVSDEVYRELWFDAPPPSFADRPGPIMIVGGMSKSHSMTGLRAGWITASADVLAPVIVAHQYITTCASVFAQRLMEALLGSPDNERWLASVREHLAAHTSAGADEWNRRIGTPVEPPAGTFYLFAPVPSCSTRRFATELIEKENVLAMPGVAFGPGGEGWLRISCAAPLESVRAGIEGISRMLNRQEETRVCD